MLPRVTPMRLLSVKQPFDEPDWIFEPKYDGFRALAYIDGHHCRLLSRRGQVYKSWPYLGGELAHSVQCHNAVLDGEVCCLKLDGRSDFYSLMFRREWAYFMAFDLLWLDGKDLRNRPLHERKRRLTRIMPRVKSRVCVWLSTLNSAESICSGRPAPTTLRASSGSGRMGPIRPERTRPGVKVRNPEYSQWDGRRELFEKRRDNADHRARWVRPELALV